MIKLLRAYTLLSFSISLAHVNSLEYWHKEIDEVIRRVDLFDPKHEMMIWSNLVANNKDLEQRAEFYKSSIKVIIALRITAKLKALKRYHPVYNNY